MSVATLPKGWGLDGPRIHSSYGTDHDLSITDTAKALSTHLYGQTKLVARLKQSPSRMALTLSRSREVMSVASSWGLPRLPRVGQGLLTHQARCLC